MVLKAGFLRVAEIKSMLKTNTKIGDIFSVSDYGNPALRYHRIGGFGESMKSKKT